MVVREEHQLLGVVLKAQPLGEADSLITWFTREQGKIRTVVASARRPHSRLQYALMPGTTVAFRVTQRTGQNNLAKLIQAIPVEVYVRDFSEGRGLVLQWLQEIIFRATPDEQANEPLFGLLQETLAVLARPDFTLISVPVVMFGVMKHLCEVLGFGISEPVDLGTSYYFNMDAGGFVASPTSGDDWFLITQEVDRFVHIGRLPIAQLVGVQPEPIDERLADLVAHFFEYHTERMVRSSRLFGAILQ
ncbi:MAG: DNA repair protein RecO [Candidatus Doudnabacteria bacterium]|nr:DNA repair protein RecO [Candidatus Doudnabacteria bacterium]